MRPGPLCQAAVIACLSLPAAAQGWIEYVGRQDFFIVNFPSQPIVRDIVYSSEYGMALPARTYTADDGVNRYVVTVVDYSRVEQMHAEKVRNCQGYPDTCLNRGPNELRGALDYAVSSFLEKNAKVTYYGYADTDRVEGRRVQLVSPDQSRTFVAVYLHDYRLYVLDGTVSGATPPPALFQQSIGFFDKDGVRVRYETVYRHGYPAPPREPGSGRLAGC
jgi:hypothetical protein